MVGEGDGWVLSTNYGSSRSVVFMKTLRTYVLVYVLVRTSSTILCVYV